MERKNSPKILFVICEGDSDDITLHRSLKNYFNNYIKNIIVEVTSGDLAYKDNINENNCIKSIEKIIDQHKKKNFLFCTDYIAIVHIIDTDGAFIDDKSIIEDSSLYANKFCDNKLFTNNKEYFSKRFEKKRLIYKKLFETNIICGIKYYKFYFSRNLEHALYGIENATLEQKIKLSNLFDKQYKLDALGFEKILRKTMNDIPNDYKESWNYIFSDSNSIKQCSNISIIFDLIKQDNLN